MRLTEIQQKILIFLKAEPDGSRAEDIARGLSLATTTVREHLNVLISAGMIQYKDTRGLIGRPRRRYFFAKTNSVYQYSWLSSLVLEELAHSLTDTQIRPFLGRIARKVADGMADEIDRLDGRQRLEKLLRIMNDLGYDVSQKSSERNETILEAKNCVYHEVAVHHPQLCEFDLQLIEDVSLQGVRLQCCIARGAKVCRFQLDGVVKAHATSLKVGDPKGN